MLSCMTISCPTPSPSDLRELRLLKLAQQRGIEQCAGHLDRHARAGAMLAAGPARVDQPTIDPTPGNTPAQKITVDAGMARHEGGAKASRECGLRLRSEEHTSELQSLMRISYAVFCLKTKKQKK